MNAPREPEPKTVAVLHLGEMGTAVARVLREAGHRVVTHLDGCGDATARRCRESGCEVLPVAEAFAVADVVISLVPPAAAAQVADAFCASSAKPSAIFVDANSIGPDLAAAIAARVEASGRPFVDAAINGLASNLTSSATLFLSGGRCDDVAALFGGRIKVQRLGGEPGRASAMKMLLAGVSKGVCALYSELLLLAAAHGLVPEFTATAATIYPSVAALAERMLPTYAQHATRRSSEMAELVETAASADVAAPIVAAIREHHAALAHHLQRHPLRRGASFNDYLTHLVDTRFAAPTGIPSTSSTF